MSDIEIVSALQESIAREVFSAANSSGKEWSFATVRYGIVGGYAAPHYSIDDGPSNPEPSPVGAYFSLPELRKAMGTDGESPWFTAVVSVQREGEFRFNFNYEDEPDWYGGPRPSEAEYERDLAEFPRVKEEIPSWFPDSLRG